MKSSQERSGSGGARLGGSLPASDGRTSDAVAGPRESKCPGIGARAEAFVGAVLDLLREPPHTP